jgi:2-polyprenyl-6-methoxyphenol hydroxylase-like FAD-dependent oxidoreductase
MPQWNFLSFLARKASAYSNFHLMMGYEVTGLLEEDGRSTGVRLCDKDGNVSALKADLTIGADGRKSVVRRKAHLGIQDLGSSVDVLWMRLSRQPSDPAQAMSHAGPSQGLVITD